MRITSFQEFRMNPFLATRTPFPIAVSVIGWMIITSAKLFSPFKPCFFAVRTYFYQSRTSGFSLYGFPWGITAWRRIISQPHSSSCTPVIFSITFCANSVAHLSPLFPPCVDPSQQIQQHDNPGAYRMNEYHAGHITTSPLSA